MITLQQYFMGRDVKYKNELTNEFITNATNLLQKVNKLLWLAGRKEVTVNSGWRPPSVNKAVGGSLTSKHMICHAIDLNDDDGSLDAWCMANLDKLEECGLWLEHPSATPRWCHLDDWPRKVRVFKP